MVTLKPPLFPTLCSSKSHKHNKYDEAPYIVSFYPQSTQANLFTRLRTCLQAKLIPHVSISNFTFSNSLANN